MNEFPHTKVFLLVVTKYNDNAAVAVFSVGFQLAFSSILHKPSSVEFKFSHF